MEDDGRLLAELGAKVRAAARRARAETVRARVLVAASAALRDERLTGRCAWCGRYQFAGLWLEPGELPRFATGAAGRIGLSHTICPDCVEELRRTGQSV
jgi:hypothetical protein